MLYLLNSPVLTTYGDYRFQGPLEPDEAKERLTNDFVSAIGHDATAALLSRLLRRIIPVNRIKVSMNPGDTALVFRLNVRLAEGTILTASDIASMDYELSWLERLP